MLELQLGLLDRRADDQVGGGAVGTGAVVVVTAWPATGVRRAGAGVVAAVVVAGLFAVATVVVAGLFAVATAVVARLFLAVAGARRRRASARPRT